MWLMQSLIFEPAWEGHRLDYVARLLTGLLSSGQNVTLALSAHAPETREFKVHLEPIIQAQRAVTIDAWMCLAAPGASTPLRAAMPLPALLRESIRRSQAQWVFVPTVDGLAQIAGLEALIGRRVVPRGVEAEALLMRGNFAYPGSLGRRAHAELAWQLAVRGKWSALYTIDPLAFQEAIRRYGKCSKLSLMPDPVERIPCISTIAGRIALGIPEQGRYVGIVGLLDERKGTHLLIDAFARAKLSGTDRLLLVGRQAPSIRRMLVDDYQSLVQGGRIIVIDRYVGNDELALAIAAANVVCTPYPHHIGSASIVIRAAAARRMVLGSQFGWIGYVVPRFGLGITCAVQDQSEFSLVIGKALEASNEFVVRDAQREFVKYHSPENFAATWTARLRERQGLQPLPGHRTWTSVEAVASAQARSPY